jgi:hypothetical protein
MALTTLTTGPSASLNGSISIPATLLDPTVTVISLQYDISNYVGSAAAMSLTADYSLDGGATWNFLAAVGLDDPNFTAPSNVLKVGSAFTVGWGGIQLPVPGVGNAQRMIRSTLTTTGPITTSLQITQSAVAITGAQSAPPGSVGVDATGTADVSFNGVTSFSFTNITVGASATALAAAIVLTCNVGTQNLPITFTSVTWNSVAMTLVPGANISNLLSGASTGEVYIFGLANPTSGAKTLAGSWSASANGYVDAISFTGTDTTTPFVNGTANTNGAGTATGSITVTSAVGNYTLAVFFEDNQSWASTNNTKLFTDASGTAGNGAANYATGAATVTLTATASASAGQWAVAGVSVQVPQSGVIEGIPVGTVFVPSKGPTRGLRPTQAFPPAIVTPPEGIPPGTIFAPVARFGPTRGLRPTQAFPPSVAGVAETNVHFVGKFTPTKYTLGFRYQSWDQSQPPVVETNPHTIGKFTPAKLAQFLYQSWDQSQPPVAETNVHTIGKFTPAKLQQFPYQSWDQAQPPVAETNVHFIGRFLPVKYTTFRYNTWDQSQPPVVETNPHTIGWFVRAKLQQFPYQSWDQSQPAVSETNVHTVGFFKPTKYTFGFQYNFQTGDPSVAVVAQPETNVHFVGTFRPVRLFVNPQLWQQADFSQPPVDGSSATIQLVLYEVPLPDLVASALYRSWDQSQPPVAETNVHFIGRFLPVKYTSFLYNSWDVEPPVVETNPHTIGWFVRARLQQFPYQSWDQAQPPVAETNVHTIGRFVPAKLQQFLFNSWDQSQPPVAETNVHFVGKFTPTKYTLGFRYQSWDQSQPPVAETNVHTIGKFVPAKYTFGFQYNFQTGDPSVAVVAQPETNVHFVGTFRPVRLFVNPQLWQHTDVGQPAVAETNPHTIGFFKNPPNWRFGYNSWDQSQPPVDGSSATVQLVLYEVPLPDQVASALYYRLSTGDGQVVVVQPETNTHFIGQFKPVKLIRTPPSWDQSQPSPAETQPHFVGRFTPAKLIRMPPSWDLAQPPVFETNPHFLGTFRPAKLLGFKFWSGRDSVEGPSGPQPIPPPVVVPGTRGAVRVSDEFIRRRTWPANNGRVYDFAPRDEFTGYGQVWSQGEAEGETTESELLARAAAIISGGGADRFLSGGFVSKGEVLQKGEAWGSPPVTKFVGGGLSERASTGGELQKQLGMGGKSHGWVYDDDDDEALARLLLGL